MTHHHTETLTNTMITSLRAEAGQAGDADMVALCDAAADGDKAGRQACADAINSARAMDDRKPFVRVVAR